MEAEPQAMGSQSETRNQLTPETRNQLRLYYLSRTNKNEKFKQSYLKVTITNYFEFETYLKSISEDENYNCWWKFYTSTDTEDKQRVNKQLSSSFDFGLMVQNLQSNQEKQKQEQEKTERLPVLSGIRKYSKNHVLLVGKPGSGKSTALKRLLLEEAGAYLEQNSSQSSVNDRTIPVLVELRYWQNSIFERIEAFLLQHDASLNLDESTLKTLLRQGRFLLLIDGVNELPSEEARRQVAIFRQDFPQTPMIFTTRDLSVGGDLGIEKKLEMQPLNEKQIRDFVMGYLPQQGEELLRCLKDRLREFGETPLLLWMLCVLFEQTGNIPPNLGMVFRLFTQSYQDNLRGDVAVTPESRRWWKSLLEHLAFEMMQGKPETEFRVAIHKSEVEDIFTQYLDAEKFDKPRDNAKCWLDDLIKHHLIQVGSSDKIEFRHQLLQEYYAAEYLLRKLPEISDDELKRDYLNLLKWTESLAVMLALVDNEAQALRVVRLALDVDLMLGARLVGEVKPEFQQQPIDWILEKKLSKLLEIELLGIIRSDCAVEALINAFKHEDSDVLSSAADAFENIGSSSAVNPFINALDHQNSSIRRSAAVALGNIGSSSAVNALINALDHQNPSIRCSAAVALGKSGSSSAVNALINALNDYNSSIRPRAAFALGKIGSSSAVDALINALNHQNFSVRSSVEYALGKIDSPRAVEALINALNHQKSYVRSSAAEALGKIGSPSAIEALIKALNDQDSFVRRKATEALEKIGSPSAIEALIKALNDQDSDVRSSTANALGKIGSPSAVEALIKALNDQDSDVRRSAAFALGKIGSSSAVAPLINAFNDQDSNVLRKAAEALGKIGSPSAVAPLIKALNHANFYVRSSAAYALGKIGSPSAVAPLINALNHKDFSVRWSAANALGQIGSPKAVETLINALNHQNSAVCRRAALLLGNIASDSAVEALIKTLNDQDLDVRNSAAEALGKIGSPPAVQTLINALNDQHSYIRSSAASALGKIGSPSAVTPLIKALNDQNSDVRRSAASALAKIGSPKAVDALISAINDQNSDIRKIAASALGNIAGSDKIAQMWKLLQNGTTEAKDLILKIQQRFKFYNHDIFYISLEIENKYKNPSLLRRWLEKYFYTTDKLRNLCQDLGITFDSLSGEGINKANDLAEHLVRKNKLPQLIECLEKNYPDLVPLLEEFE